MFTELLFTYYESPFILDWELVLGEKINNVRKHKFRLEKIQM